MTNLRTFSLTNTPEYEINFLKYLKNVNHNYPDLVAGLDKHTGGFELPSMLLAQYEKLIKKESLFRQLATSLTAYHTPSKIMAKLCNDTAAFIPEGEAVSPYDAMDDFVQKNINGHKMCSLIRLDEDFVHDRQFNLEKHLVERLSRSFGRTESNAFINGTGIDMPIGILNKTDSADIGVTSPALTYDNVIKLYFSVKPEYRNRGVWLMNDETAFTLRTLKDDNGNYLWRDSDDTILGKKVLFSEFMPNATAGNKPIAFGDFSYYWICDMSQVSIQTLIENFAVLDQIGYLSNQFLDGRLVRSEAVKVIQVTKA